MHQTGNLATVPVNYLDLGYSSIIIVGSPTTFYLTINPSIDINTYFVSDGSYLRRGDQSFLESLSKLTVCWSPGDPLEVFSNDSSFSIQVAAERLPGSVRWNGRTIKAEYDSGKSLVRLIRRRTEKLVG